MRVAKERLELANWLALVVEDRPAAPHPARSHVAIGHLWLAAHVHHDRTISITFWNPAWLGLYLPLYLAAKAVGVGES